MIITLPTTHPAAGQLANIASLLRALKRNDLKDAPEELAAALNIAETNHGNRTATYTIMPGRASSTEAIASYQYVRKHYPIVLDLLCYAASRDAREITIEIGTAAREDSIVYSHHDLLKIMPRILALFRGTVRIG